MDYSRYGTKPIWDYLPLPQAARANSTRLRWWQRAGADGDRPPTGWSLDDVLVGGMDINPSELQEHFDGGIDRAKWEFHPNGRPQRDFCGRRGTAMVWSEAVGVKQITTCQMIVQGDFMMQFKVFQSR